jgi:hypothetical protein
MLHRGGRADRVQQRRLTTLGLPEVIDELSACQLSWEAHIAKKVADELVH